MKRITTTNYADLCRASATAVGTNLLPARLCHPPPSSANWRRRMAEADASLELILNRKRFVY